MTALEQLPAKIDDLALQVLQLRTDMLALIDATRIELLARLEQTRTELGALIEKNAREMRVLHEDALSRIAVTRERNGRRSKPRRKR